MDQLSFVKSALAKQKPSREIRPKFKSQVQTVGEFSVFALIGSYIVRYTMELASSNG